MVAIYGLIMAIVFSSKLKASKTPDADQNYYTGELERSGRDGGSVVVWCGAKKEDSATAT